MFNLLKSDRPVGIGLSGSVGFIPATSIIDYAIRVERLTDAREIDRTIRMVHVIDVEYVTLQNKIASGS